VDPGSGTSIRFGPDPGDVMSLSHDAILFLLDRHQRLWVGTFNGGVDFISLFGRRFGRLAKRRPSNRFESLA